MAWELGYELANGSDFKVGFLYHIPDILANNPFPSLKKGLKNDGGAYSNYDQKQPIVGPLHLQVLGIPLYNFNVFTKQTTCAP